MGRAGRPVSSAMATTFNPIVAMVLAYLFLSERVGSIRFASYHSPFW